MNHQDHIQSGSTSFRHKAMLSQDNQWSLHSPAIPVNRDYLGSTPPLPPSAASFCLSWETLLWDLLHQFSHTWPSLAPSQLQNKALVQLACPGQLRTLSECGQKEISGWKYPQWESLGSPGSKEPLSVLHCKDLFLFPLDFVSGDFLQPRVDIICVN